MGRGVGGRGVSTQATDKGRVKIRARIQGSGERRRGTERDGEGKRGRGRGDNDNGEDGKSAHVLNTGFLVKSEILVQAESDVITVQAVSVQTLVQEVLLKSSSDGRLVVSTDPSYQTQSEMLEPITIKRPRDSLYRWLINR